MAEKLVATVNTLEVGEFFLLSTSAHFGKDVGERLGEGDVFKEGIGVWDWGM